MEMHERLLHRDRPGHLLEYQRRWPSRAAARNDARRPEAGARGRAPAAAAAAARAAVGSGETAPVAGARDLPGAEPQGPAEVASIVSDALAGEEVVEEPPLPPPEVAAAPEHNLFTGEIAPDDEDGADDGDDE